MPDISTATERLIAFESRCRGRHAEEHASECQLDERKVHDARIYEKYGKMKDNTMKTFDGFCSLFSPATLLTLLSFRLRLCCLAQALLKTAVCLPEAIEHLVMQGLSEDAAVALVSHVILDFGLTTIATQSEAFAELNRLEKAARAGDAAQIAKVETKKIDCG